MGLSPEADLGPDPNEGTVGEGRWRSRSVVGFMNYYWQMKFLSPG